MRKKRQPSENNQIMAFEPAMREAAQLVMDSLWQESVKPAIVRFFTLRAAHQAAQLAGTHVLSRMAAVDPLTDAAYEQI